MIKTSPFIIKSLDYIFSSETFIGEKELLLDSVMSINDVLDNAEYQNCFTWINDKNAASFNINAAIGLLICSEQAYDKIKDKIKGTFLITPKPRRAFQKILEVKFQKPLENKIESTAIIHPSVQLPDNCYIGHYSVLEEGVVVGNNTYIGHHNVLLANTIIGKNVHIGNHNSIGHAGYGYEKNDSGDWEHLPHLGNVIIHDNVSIHSFVSIDRGVLGSTVVERNTKIDNHVHISHNVQIGKNCMILQASSIGGSAIIEENCWLGHSVAIINKAKIGKDSFLAFKSLIIKSLPPGSRYTGAPAIKLGF